MINIRAIQAGPKILVFDVETSYMLLRGYDLYPKSGYPITAIERDWIMLGAAWMWINDEKPKAVSVSPKNPENDYEVISILHTVLSEADVIIGHNSDGFDIKKFNARAIKFGFGPISPKKYIDTLKIARRYFKFSSNKLDYIAQYLGSDGKSERPDWAKCIAGDAEELGRMRDYNKKDVLETRFVYLKLRPFHQNHPDLNVISPVLDVVGAEVNVCPKCQSPHIQSRGKLYSARRGVKSKYQCMDCGGWHSK